MSKASKSVLVLVGLLATACSAGSSGFKQYRGRRCAHGGPRHQSYLWLGNTGGKSLVLYTYKSAST